MALFLQTFSHRWAMCSQNNSRSAIATSAVDRLVIHTTLPLQLESPVLARHLKLVITKAYTHFVSIHSINIA